MFPTKKTPTNLYLENKPKRQFMMYHSHKMWIRNHMTTLCLHSRTYQIKLNKYTANVFHVIGGKKKKEKTFLNGRKFFIAQKADDQFNSEDLTHIGQTP